MPDLSRGQFCELTHLTPHALKSLARRLQLPFEVDQKATGRGYTYFEAFLMLAALELQDGHGINITRSAEIVGKLPEVLSRDWTRIVQSARQLTDGSIDKVDEIMCGRFESAGLKRSQPICGTLGEIAEYLLSQQNPCFRLTLISASRGLALLIIRSARLEFTIPENFWSAPFSYRQRFDSVEMMRANMSKQLAEGAHLETAE